jgi:hypothetical protein
MADEGPKFSQKELADVLRRAAELEAKEGPRAFDAEDLVQAGRELGLSAGTLEAVIGEHLARRSGAGQEITRPFDTRVQLEAGYDRFDLDVPRRGLDGSSVAMLGFSSFWLLFVGFWTWGASQASWVFAAFSTPFWLVGLGMFSRPFKRVFGRQKLRLGREAGVLETPPLGGKAALRTEHVRVRVAEVEDDAALRSRGAQPKRVPAVVLEHGTKTYKLLAGFSEQECRWVAAELQRWLAG